jgi:hypothetical protein
MLLAFITCDLWTTIYLFRQAVVGLLDNPLPSFPDLIQPFPWAMPSLSVPLPTLPLYCVSLPTHSILCVSTDTTSILCISTDTNFIRRTPPTFLRDVTLTNAIKRTQPPLRWRLGIYLYSSIYWLYNQTYYTCYTLRGAH